MNRRLGLWCVMGLLVWGATLGAGEILRIVPVVQGDEVLVSFELADAYTGDVREAISSGLRTTFTYDVELRMVGSLWVDRTIAAVSVSASDQYDNLTRRHVLSRTVNGRVVESSVTEDAVGGRTVADDVYQGSPVPDRQAGLELAITTCASTRSRAPTARPCSAGPMPSPAGRSSRSFRSPIDSGRRAA